MATKQLIEGWNATQLDGVEILVDDGAPVRVSVRGNCYSNEDVRTELARFRAKVKSHDLWEAAEGPDESVCPLARL